jgi:hypothetical protein
LIAAIPNGSTIKPRRENSVRYPSPKEKAADNDSHAEQQEPDRPLAEGVAAYLHSEADEQEAEPDEGSCSGHLSLKVGLTRLGIGIFASGEHRRVERQ